MGDADSVGEAFRSRPFFMGLSVLNRLGLWNLSGFLNCLQLWDLDCFFHNLHPWNLHNKVTNLLVHTLQRFCTLDHGNLFLSHDKNIIEVIFTDVHTTCNFVWILKDLILENRGTQCHGQTDKMDHNQVFLCDLGGFRTSDTDMFAGRAFCLACCKRGKVTVTVTFRFCASQNLWNLFIQKVTWATFL